MASQTSEKHQNSTSRRLGSNSPAARMPPKYLGVVHDLPVRKDDDAIADILQPKLPRLVLSESWRRVADALCASLCFARTRARLAEYALHPAVCLTTVTRSANDFSPARQ